METEGEREVRAHKFEIQTKTIQHCHDTSSSMRVNFITCYSDEVCLAILDVVVCCANALEYFLQTMNYV